MLYFIYRNNKLSSISPVYVGPGEGYSVVTRNELTFESAVKLADDANRYSGEYDLADTYLVADKGHGISPRYDVIAAPKVGNKVSRSFNGDYHPAGEVTKVSASFKRVATSDGTVFYRQGASASWVSNGKDAMVGGHHKEQNKEF